MFYSNQIEIRNLTVQAIQLNYYFFEFYDIGNLTLDTVLIDRLVSDSAVVAILGHEEVCKELINVNYQLENFLILNSENDSFLSHTKSDSYYEYFLTLQNLTNTNNTFAS